MEQVSFTEKEIKDVADYFNYVQEHASFTVAGQEITAYYKMCVNMHQHIRKMEQHIFELQRVVESPPKPPEPKKPGRPRSK